jgi:ribosomal protein L11 methyltransferase
MAWQSLRIEASGNAAEVLSDALMELGALSVSIEDADAETGMEQPIFGEPGDPAPGLWRHNVVSALFDMGVVPEHILRKVETATGLRHLKFTVE